MKKSSVVLFGLFFVVLIDAIGNSLIIPLLPPLFVEKQAVFTPHLLSSSVMYGLSLGIFTLCMFFASPLLGRYSDYFGRKKVLLVCLGGTCFGYVLSGFGVVAHSFPLFILGRVFDGFTAGSIPVAQASIADISHPERKMQNLGYILFAVSLGFILGPILSAILANSNLYSGFSITTPLFTAAVLAVLNMLILYLFYKETYYPQSVSNITKRISINENFKAIFIALKSKELRILSLSFFFMQFSWATYFQFIAMLLHDQYHFTVTQNGWYLALVGLGLGLGFCYLVKVANKIMPVQKLIFNAMALLALFFSIFLMSGNEVFVWGSALPMAVLYTVAYSAFITQYSCRVDADNQGMVMGIAGAICALSASVSAFTIGYLAHFSSTNIMLASLSTMLVAVVVVMLEKTF